MKIEPLNSELIEALAKALSPIFSGSEISSLLNECNFHDPFPKNTKWRRLNQSFLEKQDTDKCANHIIVFLEKSMTPVRHLDNITEYTNQISEINQVLSFEGLSLGDDGKIKKVKKTQTITEAQERSETLEKILKSRNAHRDIFLFCKEELLVNNYFHSVFEATKSVAEKIRKKTGLVSDGSPLVEEAFSFKADKQPYLALNNLQTQSEQSEQTGFINLLKGLFGMFRNTAAHEPKFTWEIKEQDALDILALVSLIHRRLDNATPARKTCQNK